MHNEDFKTKKEISKLYNKKNLRVKPGYKKKLKMKIFKLKQKSKRKYLDERYKKIQREKYKQGRN